MNKVKIKYTSLASPPKGVVISCKYDFGKDNKGYFYSCGQNKFYEDIEIIKALFTPVDSDWDKVLKVEKTTKPNK